MKEFYAKIQLMPKKRRLGVFALAVFFLVFEAIFIFPLKYELSDMNVLMIYPYFMIGFLLYATSKKGLITIFFEIILANIVGLGLRVWLEWGEYSMIRNLNLKNVLLTYIPITITVFIGYLYTKTFLESKTITK